jgi:hypothetical protein
MVWEVACHFDCDAEHSGTMVDWGKSRRLGEKSALSLLHPPYGSHGLMWRWIRTCYQINNEGPIHSVGSRKDTSSIPDGVIEIFHWYNPSGHTMSLVSTQLLTEMGTGIISWIGGKGVQCVWLRTLPLSCVECLEIWELQPLETIGPVQACTGIALPVHSIRSTCDACLHVFIMVWSEIL